MPLIPLTDDDGIIIKDDLGRDLLIDVTIGQANDAPALVRDGITVGYTRDPIPITDDDGVIITDDDGVAITIDFQRADSLRLGAKQRTSAAGAKRRSSATTTRPNK